MNTTPPSPRSRAWLARSPLGWIGSGFGAGLSPIAPGTAGTAVGLLLFWPMRTLSPLVLIGAIVLLFLIGVYAAAHVARQEQREDPGLVVVDEIVGMWISLLFVPWSPATAAGAFVLFRIMDVVKPFPARRLEDLPGGWGIMADDVMAGVYANVALQAILWATRLW
jgi:phosphatidylglycerophosphatase A